MPVPSAVMQKVEVLMVMMPVPSAVMQMVAVLVLTA